MLCRIRRTPRGREKKMTLPIITISREFGSKGREIGEQVARSLGIECYDKRIVMEAAAASGLSPEVIA